MSIVHNQSTAQRTLILSSNDLVALINRVNQLQVEHKKFEHKNQVTQERVNKIIEMKQKAYITKEKQAQDQNDKLYEQQAKYARIQQLRSETHQDRQVMLQALQDQRSQDYLATKQQSLMSQLKFRELQNQEQNKRREQTDKIMKWQSDQKEYLQNYWDQKVSSLKMEQDKNKNKFIIQTSMQNKAIDELEKIELDLIGKLKTSQFVSQELTSQLNQALISPHQELNDLQPSISEQNGPNIIKSGENWQKKISQSPYLALPVVVRNNRKYKKPKSSTTQEIPNESDTKSHSSLIHVRKLAAAASLPGLAKPNYKTQQVTVDRLYKSKKEYLEKIELLRQKDFEQQVTAIPFVVKTVSQKKTKPKFQFQKKTMKVASGSRKNTETPVHEEDEKPQTQTLPTKEKIDDEEDEYQEDAQDFQEENADEAESKQQAQLEPESKLDNNEEIKPQDEEKEQDYEEEQYEADADDQKDQNQQNEPKKVEDEDHKANSDIDDP